jgi:hypothetical protein
VLFSSACSRRRIIVKRAYADWTRYSEYRRDLHEAAIELIEIPTRQQTGKNSADIRLVVDALDLCYTKEHLDTFVVVSGDSDFSPLVSKLKENNKQVIGLGLRDAASNLLADNCDEFLFYEVDHPSSSLEPIPSKKQEAFNLLVRQASGRTGSPLELDDQGHDCARGDVQQALTIPTFSSSEDARRRLSDHPGISVAPTWSQRFDSANMTTRYRTTRTEGGSE